MKSHWIASLLVLVLAFAAVSGGTGREEQEQPAAEKTSPVIEGPDAAGCCGADAHKPEGKLRPVPLAPVPHCPQYLAAIENGVYYYACEICDGGDDPENPGTCATGDAYDTEEHLCGNCETDEDGNCVLTAEGKCTDGGEPIFVGTFAPRVAARGDQGTNGDQQVQRAPRQLSRYTAPRASTAQRLGPPGSSMHTSGQLFLPPGVTHNPGSDRVVKVTVGDDKYYFRVFTLRLRVHGRPPHPYDVLIGQQLDPTELGDQKPKDGTMLREGDSWNHVIYINEDGERHKYKVISKDAIAK